MMKLLLFLSMKKTFVRNWFLSFDTNEMNGRGEEWEIGRDTRIFSPPDEPVKQKLSKETTLDGNNDLNNDDTLFSGNSNMATTPLRSKTSTGSSRTGNASSHQGSLVCSFANEKVGLLFSRARQRQC